MYLYSKFYEESERKNPYEEMHGGEMPTIQITHLFKNVRSNHVLKLANLRHRRYGFGSAWKCLFSLRCGSSLLKDAWLELVNLKLSKTVRAKAYCHEDVHYSVHCSIFTKTFVTARSGTRLPEARQACCSALTPTHLQLRYVISIEVGKDQCKC